MRANIKLPLGFVIISSIFALSIAYLSYSVISILLILGVLYLVIYLLLGVIKRKDALIILDDKILIKTPFKNKEFDFKDIKSIYLDSDGKQLKGIVIKNEYEEEVKLFSDIYDIPLSEIYQYLINKHSYLAEKQED